MIPLPSPVAAVIVVVGAAVVLPSCGSGRDGAVPAAPSTALRSACDTVVVEPLDPRSAQHLLPGAPVPSYAADPPTSGPHLSGGAVSGAQAEPLAGPVQVAVLEEGGVIVQYRPNLPEEGKARLAELTGDKVVVAPNPALPDPVVATAWRHRLACRSVDLAALRAFISERAGKGPG
ncbi:MAG: DUF3105 domain-containing protein [Actinomycetota bacterium]|nr:DUF3105 domain-containing protein [Actinomycetota bacterium]PLS76401.1 MAG: hypothetical protein CYG61_02425 [Actinomycetota bacterium]